MSIEPRVKSIATLTVAASRTGHGPQSTSPLGLAIPVSGHIDLRFERRGVATGIQWRDGGTRQRVNQLLKQREGDGLIEQGYGRILLVDRARLERLAQSQDRGQHGP